MVFRDALHTAHALGNFQVRMDQFVSGAWSLTIRVGAIFDLG